MQANVYRCSSTYASEVITQGNNAVGPCKVCVYAHVYTHSMYVQHKLKTCLTTLFRPLQDRCQFTLYTETKNPSGAQSMPYNVVNYKGSRARP